MGNYVVMDSLSGGGGERGWSRMWGICKVTGIEYIEWSKQKRNGYVRYSDKAQLVIFPKDILISARYNIF